MSIGIKFNGEEDREGAGKENSEAVIVWKGYLNQRYLQREI